MGSAADGYRSILETGVARDSTFLMTSDALLPVYKLDGGFAVSILEREMWIQTSDVPAGFGEHLVYGWFIH